MSEGVEILRIPKATGTHGDVFAAVGLADVIASLPGLEGVRLVEKEAAFEVCLPRPLEEGDLDRVPQVPGYPFLKANEKVTVPRGAVDAVDYKAERAKAQRRKEAVAGKRKGALDPETQQLLQQEELREDWRLLQVLNTVQGDETANRVHQAVVSMDPGAFHRALSHAFGAIQRGEASGVAWKANTVQLFTPVAAKGYGRLKPDGTDRNDKTKEQWADPFVEWLRYRGYFRAACPFFQGSKAEHVRLLCPVPRDIPLGALKFLARELRRGGVYGGPPKMDALAVLRLADLLVRHSEDYHDPDC